MSQSANPLIYEGGTLRVGDIITLRQSKPFDGWLSAEEFLGDTYVKRPIGSIEDSLWEVQVQQQYICSQEYDNMFSESMQRALTPDETEVLEALHAAAENEEYLNKKLMAMKIGKPVVFGDVIQLKHKKSLKLLTVSSSTLAKSERENMKVQITPLGDVNSWLELIPRYKYDHEGQVIPNGAEFLLRVRERSSEFIHGAKKPLLNDDAVREVNSSLDSSSWTLNIYQHAVPKTDKSLFCGYLVSLQDIELSSYVTLPEKCEPNCDVVASPPTRLSFVATDCNIGTGMLWMIEQKKFYIGGLLDEYVSVSLRHFNSGLFMKIGSGGAVMAVVDRADASYFDFVVSQSSDGSNSLQEGCSVQLNYQGNWLSLHRAGSERVCVATKDKAQAIQLVISATAFRLFDSDLFMCNACSHRMRTFEKMVSMNALRGNAHTEYIIRSLFSVLEQLDEFLNPDDATVSRSFARMGITIPFLRAKDELCIMRQTILREQGGLDSLILLLSCTQTKKIPEDVAFDRKHLSILGQVGATDLNRLKPKKRILEVAESSRTSAAKSGKHKFKGAARSIAAINKIKHEVAGQSSGDEGGRIKVISHLKSPDVSKDDDEEGKILSVNVLLTVANFIGGLKRNNKVKAAAVSDSNDNYSSAETGDNEKELDQQQRRFLFRQMKSLKNLMKQAPSHKFSNAESVKEGDLSRSHDHAEVQQLQVLDETHASLGAYLAHFCLKVLLSAIISNRPNQMALADSLGVILGQVMDNPIAVFCVQTMLTGNLPMLQNKIKDKEIQLFLDLVRNNTMNATFVRLLRNTCVCPMGIDATQRIISVSLFGDNNTAVDGQPGALDMSQFVTTNHAHKVLLDRARGDRASISLINKEQDLQPIIISLSADVRATHKAIWAESKLYFPSSEGQLATVLGFTVVSRGVPKLYIEWNEVDGFRMFNLFGYHSRVPIETLCVVLADSIKKEAEAVAVDIGGDKKRKYSVANRRASAVPKGRKQSISPRVLASHGTISATEIKIIKKAAVADYFVTQLYLAGALCLDRNYVAIRILEAHYSYENLLSMLQTKSIVNEIKAPICSLLHSLYIDREPQVAVKFPRLIRTSVSLGGGDENQLNPQPYKFAVLQHIISDYIRGELDIAHCDELSNEMMELLSSLMTFGFYSSTEQLADVIFPLLQALETHRISNVMRPAEVGPAEPAAKSSSSKNSSIKNKRRELSSKSVKTVYVDDRSSQLKSSRKVSPKIRLSKSSDADSDSDDDAVSWYTIPFRAFRKFSRKTKEPRSIRRASITDANSLSVTRAKKMAGGQNGVTGGAESGSKNGRRNSLLALSPTETSAGLSSAENMTGKGKYQVESFILDHMQSNRMLFFVLLLVAVSTVLSVLNVTGAVSFSTDSLLAYYAFDLFVSGFFMLDLLIRYTCVARINSNSVIFFHDFFNCLDAAIVAMDVVLLSIGGFGTASFALVKGLRVIRFARVTRVVRAARIITNIAKQSDSNEEWVQPARYSHIEPMEAATVTGILRVINLTKQRIQDRHLGTILKTFVTWNDNSNEHIRKDPVIAYKEAISMDSGATLIPDKKFDDILLDIIMYSDVELVEEALHMLMVHKSQERLLLEATSKIQIISKPEVEEKCKILAIRLRSLRNTAETFEIWGELKTEEDTEVAKGMIESLKLLIGYVKVQSSRKIIESGAQTSPDVEMQQLLLNMDALTTFMMIQEALTAESDKPPEIILDIVRLCNEMLCWFVMWNHVNQEHAFKYLNWFIEKLDFGVNCSAVIKNILWSNRKLIKEAPKTLIATCAQRIMECGQKPDYLDILVGLTHVVDTGDSGVLNIRNEIAKVITNKERSGFFSNWCASPGTKYYNERKEAMAPFLDTFPGPEDKDLPPELLYHVNYIHLLSGCKLGPKLQAIYPIDDIVYAIVDCDTIYQVRSALGLLLKQTVEQYAENLDISESMWRFLEFTMQTLCKLKIDTSTNSPKLKNSKFRFETAQWVEFTLEVVEYFFDYFGIASFTQALAYDTEVYFAQTKRTVPEVQHLINELCLALAEHTTNSYIGSTLRIKFLQAMTSVSRHVDEDTAVQFENVRSQSTSSKQDSAEDSKYRFNFRRTGIANQGEFATEMEQATYRRKFFEFVNIVTDSCGDAELYASAIDLLEHVPSIHDNVVSDVRFEPLILKLMMHIKSQLKTSVMSRTLEKVSSETTLWLLKTLRLMIEKSMGYTVKDICDPSFHYDQSPPRALYLQNTLNSSGVTEMCLDLIAVGIEQSICVQAAQLLVCLLARSGGNAECQTTVYSYLSLTDSSLFFEQLKEMIELQVLWCQRDAESGDVAVELPDQIIVLKLIHLMCEGNYQDNKNMIREQDGNIRFVNILGSLVEYIKLLSRTESLGCTEAAVRVTNTIVLLIQGPCVGNQEYFVLHSDLLAALNRLLRSTRPVTDSTQEWDFYMELLKENIIDTLRACIEAQRRGSAVMERVESVTEVNVLNVLILSSDDLTDSRLELTPLQSKYLAFLPTLNAEQDLAPHIKRKLSNVIAGIEVIWDKEIHHIYFDVPYITKGISDSRKKKMMTEIEGANQDEKLKDFMKRVSCMYIEVVHTEWLHKVGMHGILRWENRVGWMMFWNALGLNFLLVRYLEVNPQLDEIEDLPPRIALAVFILSTLQGVMCCLTLFFLITIKLPVRYKIARMENKSKFMAANAALTEPLLMWYSAHLLITLISFYYFNHLIVSLLLLDFIVLDSTNKTFLYAVYIPARLLITNIIVTLILLQIGACAVFIWYRDQYINFDVMSMWDSFRIAVAYGLRAVEGLGQLMNEVTDDRAFFDVIMFFTVVVLLRNIFFGIIIDTFGKLRDTKAEKEADAANRCFICGIDRFEYDKRVPHGSINFMVHRESVHNMWNYMYFAMKIWRQPRDQDSGLEVYVRKCIAEGDVGWMPVGRIGVLELDDTGRKVVAMTAPRPPPVSRKKSTIGTGGVQTPIDDFGDGNNDLENFDLDLQFGLITEKLAQLATQDVPFNSSGPNSFIQGGDGLPDPGDENRSIFSSSEVATGPDMIRNQTPFHQVELGEPSMTQQALIEEAVKHELADVHNYVQKLKSMLVSISGEVARMERMESRILNNTESFTDEARTPKLSVSASPVGMRPQKDFDPFTGGPTKARAQASPSGLHYNFDSFQTIPELSPQDEVDDGNEGIPFTANQNRADAAETATAGSPLARGSSRIQNSRNAKKLPPISL